MTYPFSGPSAGTRFSATVKWNDPAKGYGFLVPVDGSPDIYCRETALTAVGLDTLLAGATVACETAQGQRGTEVSRILSVERPAAGPGPGERSRSFDSRSAAPQADAPPPADMAFPVTVKFFDPARGFGFVTDP